MRLYGKSGVARLMAGVATGAMVLSAGAAWAQSKSITVEPQPLMSALHDFGSQIDRQIFYTPEILEAKVSSGVAGASDEQSALTGILEGTGLTFRREANGYVIVRQGEGGSGPQGGSAANDGADVEALIVTAQKREEAIQDVPIAISAFTQRSLEEQKIEGGYDLMKAIPNVTFSKSNFSSYNFSIRGIGTKAISATTDPGVAVAFNNTTLVQNRLFEQEYFDVERVEVLRGPQGTLYGRNATAGVINVITAKPKLHEFEGSVKLEGGNFDTQRVVGMVNIPIINDMLAIRVAGAATKRSGYDFNSVTGNAVNGRDLWSIRTTIGFEPTENIRANLIWERFEEDDDRSRTGKQLCHRDPGRQTVGGVDLAPPGSSEFQQLIRPAFFSQGCKPGSLYEDGAFGTPNGVSLPFIFGAMALSSDSGPGVGALFPIGFDPITDRPQGILRLTDPYGGMMQSPDLRTIASFRDPRYMAAADLFELSIDLDLTDELTFTSQTAYNEDTVYSFQDYNRFNTLPVFNDTEALYVSDFFGTPSPSPYANLAPGGYFTDPQLGRSNTIAGFDISQAEGRQFSQEFRLQSDFEGVLNFSVGANYTRFETVIDYYVFYNLFTALALLPPFHRGGDAELCAASAFQGAAVPGPVSRDDPRAGCPYIDPNPIESINGEGHNYFRSKNPYKLRSAAAFGEFYWNINEDLKLTAGLRYTDDLKTFVPVPSQVLLAKGVIGGGTTNRGYPEKPPIEQQWGEFTGRLGLDWKPVLPFTDQTMVYGFYSRGYKGGGANPPSPGFATGEELFLLAKEVGSTFYTSPLTPTLTLNNVEYGRTFEPEFVNAFEVGAKNTLLGGALTLNFGAFFYDYTDYQVSQIRDRTAVNENFDAKIWGLEFESVFAPTRNLRINANLGYLDTEIADGETSIDIMNRTQGNPDYVLVKPWAQLPSNCVVPGPVAGKWATVQPHIGGYWGLCGGVKGGPIAAFTGTMIDPNPLFGGGLLPYDPANYPEINGGAGIMAQLGGNELPNSPHWTANLGAQYGIDVPGGWRATVRGDGYWQSQSYARVYNAVNDKLRGWYNLNLSVWLEQPDWGVKVELYAKNVFDDTPITDAFLNSDDSGLTTNVFVLDPRIVGLSIRKDF